MPDDPSLALRFCGLALPNPVGIAAGFDKDARVPDAVLALGCGFAEVGTRDAAAAGRQSAPARLPPASRPRASSTGSASTTAGQPRRSTGCASASRPSGIVGVNIGANKDAADRTADYVQGIEAFYDVASYFTVNISSPNTPGLRDLQSAGRAR